MFLVIILVCFSLGFTVSCYSSLFLHISLYSSTSTSPSTNHSSSSTSPLPLSTPYTTPLSITPVSPNLYTFSISRSILRPLLVGHGLWDFYIFANCRHGSWGFILVWLLSVGGRCFIGRGRGRGLVIFRLIGFAAILAGLSGYHKQYYNHKTNYHTSRHTSDSPCKPLPTPPPTSGPTSRSPTQYTYSYPPI